jgi:superfamily II DNA/RNA helicase
MNTKVIRKMPAYSRGSFGNKSTSGPRKFGASTSGESTGSTSSYGHRSSSSTGGTSSYGHRSGASTYCPKKTYGNSHSSFSRGPSSSRGSFGGNRGGGRRGPVDQRIDPARFVNKAVITETVEKFIPEHAFNDFEVDARIKANIAKHGFTAPTPIQDKAIPHVIKGQDVVGIANTGTGKTAAFLIPLINKILINPREKVIVMVPTRELAIQIEAELRLFTPMLRIFGVCCVGGAPIGRQISQLKLMHSFVIGTPGRIKDLIERKFIRLEEFKTVVLDEADRMLDMGFINDMRLIMSKMAKDRQTLFFSATLSPEIVGLIKEFLREPVTISVKTRDTAKNVDQDIVRIGHGNDKVKVLRDMLEKAEFTKVLVFGRTKHGVEKLSKLLSQSGVKAESIHGNKNHTQRQRALGAFKDNHLQVLVATDVAARGLDIPDVSHVINFDLPATYDDYVHRIGRTGRGDKTGKALTFIG